MTLQTYGAACKSDSACSALPAGEMMRNWTTARPAIGSTPAARVAPGRARKGRRRAVCGRTACTDRWGAGGDQRQSASPCGARRLPPTRHNLRAKLVELRGQASVARIADELERRAPSELRAQPQKAVAMTASRACLAAGE